MKHLFDWIEQLEIGQGREAGNKIQLFPWQRRFLRGAFGVDGDAALSIARGGGKTTFVAAIATAFLAGPLIQPMAEVLIVASSFDQGLIAFRHIQHFMAPQLDADAERKRKDRRWRVQDSANRATITNLESGTMLRVLGSDPRRLHGAAPSLMLLDEVAQWPETQVDRMIAALTTARGKIPNSKALWLGTRPSRSDHPFEEALKGGVAYSQVYAAGKDDPPFRKTTWRKANPGLNRLPDLEKVIREEASRARESPTALAHFRALRLNMGVPDTVENVLVEADVWLAAECEPAPPSETAPYVLGIDLGTSAAMSAAAAYWPDSYYLEAFAVFPENPDLVTRGRNDGVGRLYADCATLGQIIQAGDQVSDVGELLSTAAARWGYPAAIVCDRWREAELRQALHTSGFPLCDLIVRGMGFQDGGADVREFRRAVLDKQVTPARSLLMRSAMSGARVTTDAAGNSKLAKGGQGKRLRARDDAAAAAILAVAHGRRGGIQKPGVRTAIARGR